MLFHCWHCMVCIVVASCTVQEDRLSAGCGYGVGAALTSYLLHVGNLGLMVAWEQLPDAWEYLDLSMSVVGSDFQFTSGLVRDFKC